MRTLPWHKFYVDNFISTMHKFPNHIIGKWMRVFCTMAQNKQRWTITGDIEEWSRIIAENNATTKQFLNYVIDHFIDAEVRIKMVDHKQVYTITDLHYVERNPNDKVMSLLNVSKRSDFTKNRAAMMDKILNAYHPEKLLGQNSRFKKEFTKVMQEVSKGGKTLAGKIETEREKCIQILEHIKFLSKTPEWEEPSLLPTLNDYFISRAWVPPPKVIPSMKKRIEDMLTEEPRGEDGQTQVS